MAAFIFVFLILISDIFLHVEAFDATCPPAKCGDGAPDIRFPFRLKGQQPQHCGYPGFELVCKENSTMIQFPSYGDLVIQSISYDMKKLNLLDPKSCVHEVFLNLNLSLTPFQYYYHVKNYTYLNCSAQLSPSFAPVPCLILISDNTFGLGLTWTLPGCNEKGGHCNLQSKTGDQTSCFNKGFSNKHLVIGLITGIFAFIVAILISIKIHNSKKLDGQKEKESHLQVQKSFGDYKALKTAEYSIKMGLHQPV
ncbi:hypothetical protein AAG906_034242 [Vitis piasezkii]